VLIYERNANLSTNALRSGVLAELYVNAATTLPKLNPGPERIGLKNAACDDQCLLNGVTLELASHIDLAARAKHASTGRCPCAFSLADRSY